MAAENHIPRVCAKCGGQLQNTAEACPWCHTPLGGSVGPQRVRVRKKRSVLKTYFEHVRRHWLYFFLAILAGLVAAWLLLNFVQRPSRQANPAPASISLFP
ncbi:MAG: hypothetical protein HY234_12295 [Acidobacteria bacterium]|nr:hypothetical protein [Acidobacteriota bacterium]